MSEIALRMEHVYKKFRKGEVFNSLRDFLPAMTGKMFRQQPGEPDKREFWALQDISFQVKRGEALGIIGPNGAGKSTILKILSRVMTPTTGSMAVNGRLSALIEVSAGFHQDLTGRENIYLNGTILGMTKREIDSKLDQIIDFSGIEEFIDTPVKRYSSGMYARLGFSVAAHVNPDVLIVDEVLSVGDYVFQLKCLKRMREILSEGASVLFVSHNLKSVAEFCPHALLLEHGRMVTIGPTDEVVSSYLNLHERDDHSKLESRAAEILKVTVRNQAGQCLRFQSGEQAWIDIELVALEPCKELALVLIVKDDQFHEISNTSSERLGHKSMDVAVGDRLSCTFQVDLNMPSGVFYITVLAYRYATQTLFARRDPAATVHLDFARDIRGSVNCFQKVTKFELTSASPVDGAPHKVLDCTVIRE